MQLAAYAKLNLTLDILSRRDDGFHEVCMVMQSVSLHDTVTVEPAEKGITCRCGELPGDESNLAVRAAQAFFAATEPHGVDITIEKRIPVCAGMAGGSTDAAAVLRALRELFAPQMPMETLLAVGAEVGSDVPYCILGGTALAQGRGEKLTALPPCPKLFAVICKPDFPISTPMLYRRADAVPLTRHPDTAAMLKAIRSGDAAGVLASVGNVFEEVLPPECGEVFGIRDRLLECGAEAAAMTGSGPTVFGLFRDAGKAQSAYKRMKATYPQTFSERFV